MANAVTYHHTPHPRTIALREGRAKPVRVRDQLPRANPFQRFNTKLGLGITIVVGTMWCAYVFAVIAFLSLPSAISSHNLTILIAWISSNFLQLILLPIIIVGQNIQAKSSDKRAEETYKDAEAVLHEATEIQRHLAAQDLALSQLIAAAQGPSPAGPTATS
jgi:hypothetical protein